MPQVTQKAGRGSRPDSLVHGGTPANAHLSFATAKPRPQSPPPPGPQAGPTSQQGRIGGTHGLQTPIERAPRSRNPDPTRGHNKSTGVSPLIFRPGSPVARAQVQMRSDPNGACHRASARLLKAQWQGGFRKRLKPPTAPLAHPRLTPANLSSSASAQSLPLLKRPQLPRPAPLLIAVEPPSAPPVRGQYKPAPE